MRGLSRDGSLGAASGAMPQATPSSRRSEPSWRRSALAGGVLFVVGAGASLVAASCSSGSSPVTPSEGPGPSSPSPDGSAAPPDVSPPGHEDGGADAAVEPPEPPSVRFVGRFDEREAAGPKCGWPGCRILANFRGDAVSVTLDEAEMPDGPSEWDLAVDGEWKSKLVLQVGSHSYDLASGLSDGEHRVELYKRTESQTGVTQFLGFDFHGGTLLSPPPRQKRRIEIVGDSDVAGYGYAGASNGGVCDGQAWKAKYQDFHAAWGARVGQAFDAELSGTVFSGKGFYYNAWRPDTATMGVLYPRANPEDETSQFDFSKFVPDVIVVSLGGNDYNLGQPEDTGPAPLAGFTDKVRDLMTTMRGAYPTAHVFLMAYATLSDDDPPGRQKRTNVVTALTTVTNEYNARGDARVYFIAPPVANYTELTACDGHGGPEYHARIATFVQGEIAARTGW